MLESSPEPRMSPSAPVPNAGAGEHVCANASADHAFSRKHDRFSCPRPFWRRRPLESTPKPMHHRPPCSHHRPPITQCVALLIGHANAHAHAHPHSHAHNIRAQRHPPPARLAPKASLPVAVGDWQRETSFFYPSALPVRPPLCRCALSFQLFFRCCFRRGCSVLGTPRRLSH